MGQGSEGSRGLELVKKTTDKQEPYVLAKPAALRSSLFTSASESPQQAQLCTQNIWFSSSTPAHISSVTGCVPSCPLPGDSGCPPGLCPHSPLLVITLLGSSPVPEALEHRCYFPKLSATRSPIPPALLRDFDIVPIKRWDRCFFPFNPAVLMTVAYDCTPWRRKWLPTPVVLPGKFHGQRGLVGYSPGGPKESDLTEHAHTHTRLWQS